MDKLLKILRITSMKNINKIIFYFSTKTSTKGLWMKLLPSIKLKKKLLFQTTWGWYKIPCFREICSLVLKRKRRAKPVSVKIWRCKNSALLGSVSQPVCRFLYLAQGTCSWYPSWDRSWSRWGSDRTQQNNFVFAYRPRHCAATLTRHWTDRNCNDIKSGMC